MVQEAERYRDEDEANEVKIDAKKRLEDNCVAARKIRTGEKLEGKKEAGDKEKFVQDASGRLDENPLAEQDEFASRRQGGGHSRGDAETGPHLSGRTASSSAASRKQQQATTNIGAKER